jgi:hypothetical protein
MTLQWNESTTSQLPEGVVGEQERYIVHASSSAAKSESEIVADVNGCIDKAAQLMGDNIVDASLYLLFNWNPVSATLTAVVTDDTKTKDSLHIVCCSYPALESVNPELQGQNRESVKYMVSNYLTTNSDFMRFSLVAAFYSGARTRVELL